MEAAAHWQEGPVIFQTRTFQTSHYNTADYNNPHFQPEEWTPDSGDAIEPFDPEEQVKPNKPRAIFQEQDKRTEVSRPVAQREDVDETDLLDKNEPERASQKNVALDSSMEPLIETCVESMSDISDITDTSVTSVTDSLLSILSSSSTSSVAEPKAASERLVNFLLGDDIIHPLCIDGVNIITPDRFERNLRRLLNSFAVDLKKEATNQKEKYAAQFVRSRARNAAHIICNTVTPLSSKPRLASRRLAIVEELSSSSDSERSEDAIDDFRQLEEFIKASWALGNLRERLRAFVYPKMRANDQNNEEKDGLEKNAVYELPPITIGAEPPSTTVKQQLPRIDMQLIERLSFSLKISKPVAPGKVRIEWRCVSQPDAFKRDFYN